MSKNKLSNDWSVQSVSDLFYIGSGEAAPHRSNDLSGPVLVYGANGPIGSYDRANYGPGYIIGRVGTTGEVTKVSFRVWASDNTLTATPKVGVCDHDFGGYLLEFLNLPRLATKNAQPLLTQTNIASLCAIISENVEEQRRIAEILDTIDEAIQKTEALISKLKAMKQGLLHDLLTRGLDGNGKLRDPKAHPEQFKDSPFGLVPVDWDVVNLGALSTLVTSGSRGWASLYSDQGALFLRIGNLTRDHVNLRLDDVRYVLPPPTAAEGKRTRVGEGDLLISITADLGIIGVIPDGLGEAYVNQHIALVRLDRKSANPYWVANYLAFGASQKQFYMLNDQGAKAGINLPTVESLLIAVPEVREQDRIAALIAAHDTRIRTEEQYRDKLKLQKKGLMHDLLTGKVRVRV